MCKMKDTTKHIIAKEIHFFFKWLLIGAGGAFVLFLPLLISEFTPIVPRWLKDTTAVVVPIVLLTPIWLYVYRSVKWLVQWVNKWK